ncbi:MAG: efflux RND transporter permease subunit, partial [Hyphomonas sp.]|nr:efflux RND transporter permease subunit [Hyphomonas sp.]
MRTLFFRFPRLTALAILVVLFGGIGALLSLGRQEDPTLVERFGLVVVTLPGADAERMEALIAEPLEAALMELPEVKQVETTARSGVVQASINIRDDLTNAEVDDAWTLVRQQVAKAQQSFPATASRADITRFYVGASTMVVSLTWTGADDPPLAVMRRLGLDLRDTFQRLPGTELTETFGMPVEEVRVIVDGDTLAAAGVSITSAANAIAASDSKAPAGRLRTDGGTLGVEVGGELDSIGRVRSVPIVQTASGSVLRVGDVATVLKGFEDPPSRMAFENNQRAVLVAAYISPNQRVDRWAEAARQAVAGFEAGVPPGIKVEIVFDQSVYTTSRLNGLAMNLGFSALIVFCVLFLTMGWRSAFVCGTAMPLTIALVLILFNIYGHPLHQMSVTGLVISLGLLIDNAIVVVDDIDQWRAKGLSRSESIDRSLKHLMAPLAASTLTTALAFAPIAMLPG